MISFLLFCIASIGMTNIIVDSSLFEPIRGWLKERLHPKVYELFECHQCAGTWCGMICGSVLISWNPVFILMCGCAGSFLASTHYLVTEWILSKTDFSIEMPEMNDETETPR